MDLIKHKEILIEALRDYKKWFEDCPDKQLEIDLALESINQEPVSNSASQTFFSITALSKGDIIETFDGDVQINELVKNLSDDDMKYLASKMADDYCNQLFWDSLKIIFDEHVLSNTEVKNHVE
jgi:hypothetical protein